MSIPALNKHLHKVGRRRTAHSTVHVVERFPFARSYLINSVFIHIRTTTGRNEPFFPADT